MRKRSPRVSMPTVVRLLASLMCVAPGCGPNPPPSPDAGPTLGANDDADGDSISDLHERREERVDTDLDGTPDFADRDSDGDGIPDSVEAGDQDLGTPPRDSDGDGRPDAYDTDSDENGLPDRIEGLGDFDGDGVRDYADRDDDNDLVSDRDELAGIYEPFADSDGDGRPNFRDPDSDNDGILDGDEFGFDTDLDALFDFEDLDTDSDGIPDADEAGDDDVYSPPIDSDGDSTPDFRDTDSDNDGLSDASERRFGSNPRLADSDGDEVSDLIEIAGATDPNDPEENPRTQGDFVFVVPFEEPAQPERDTLEFRTSIQFADVYFLFDISGSMGPIIGALQSAVTSITEDLTCDDSGVVCERDGQCTLGDICSAFSGTCIEDPGPSNCVPSPFTGAGYYEEELEHQLSSQSDPAVTSAEMASWSTFGGTENLYRALIDSVASPGAYVGQPRDCTSEDPGTIGCAGFRREAVRVLVVFTDEDNDATELNASQVGAAFREAGVTLIGIWSGSSGDRGDLRDAVVATGSFGRNGAPLIFDGTGAGVVEPVIGAINEVVEGVPLRVTIAAEDVAGDDGDALMFIDYLEVNASGGRCSTLAPLEDTDGDGRDDAFPSVLPGTPVCWDVVPRPNTTVRPTAEPQVFRARLTVSGDGSPLDGRNVFFLVPPVIDPPGGPD